MLNWLTVCELVVDAALANLWFEPQLSSCHLAEAQGSDASSAPRVAN